MHTHHRHEDAEHVESKNSPPDMLAKGADVEKMQPVTNTPKPASGSSSSIEGDQLRDGYRETEGQEYDEEQPAAHAPEYDPTHSGVRHSRRKPGAPATAPGRDEGTAWAEQKQMGSTTDTPQPKNPAS